MILLLRRTLVLYNNTEH